MPYTLSPGLRTYGWGSKNQIPEFLGLAPSPSPTAEAWFGNHPDARTSIVIDGKEVDFSQWLRDSSAPFPLLVKLLSADLPLSIQAHPNSNQAREGFRRERIAGVSLNQEAVFKDEFAKPEMIVALSETFVALWGFVTDETFHHRKRLFAGGGLDISLWPEPRLGDKYPKHFVEWVLEGSEAVAKATNILNRWLNNVNQSFSSPEERNLVETLRNVARAHEYDPGILIACLMHVVTLKRHEALYVAPGVVHAYVKGFGLEVMSPSDNVVRAGLTRKQVHPEAFLDIALYSPTKEPPLIPVSGLETFLEQEDAPFTIECVTPALNDITLRSDSIVVAESGQTWIGQAGAMEKMSPGDTVFAKQGECIRARDEDSVAWILRPRL